MSDNKIQGGGNTSSGWSALEIGESLVDAVLPGAATKVDEKSADEQPRHQDRDSVESEAGAVDEFLGWAGDQANSAIKGAKAGAQALEGPIQTVGDLANYGASGVIGRAVGEEVGEAAAPVVQRAGRAVSDAIVEEFEPELRATELTIDELRAMGVEDFMAVGLDELAIPNREGVDKNIGDSVELARERVLDTIDLGPHATNHEVIEQVVTSGLGAGAEVADSLARTARENEAVGEKAQTLGEVLGVAGQGIDEVADGQRLETRIGLEFMAGVAIGLGAALEQVDEVPELADAANVTMLKVKDGIEAMIPEQDAAKAASLDNGGAFKTTLGFSGDVHSGKGAKGSVTAEMVVKRAKDGSFLVSLAGKSKVGAGLGATGKGTVDAVGFAQTGIEFKVEDEAAIEQLTAVLKSRAFGAELADVSSLLDGVSLNKVGPSGYGAGIDAEVLKIIKGGGAGRFGTTLIANGEGMDLELSSRNTVEAAIEFSNSSVNLQRPPGEFRDEIARQLERGDLQGVMDSFSDDAVARAMVAVKTGNLNSAIKIGGEKTFSVRLPAKQGEEVPLEQLKMTYETKVTIDVERDTVEMSEKVEIRDPVGLARAMGTSAERVIEMARDGDLDAQGLEALGLGRQLESFVTIEKEVKYVRHAFNGVKFDEFKGVEFGVMTDWSSAPIVLMSQKNTDAPKIIGQAALERRIERTIDDLEAKHPEATDSPEPIRAGGDDARDEIASAPQQESGSQEPSMIKDMLFSRGRFDL